VASGFKVITPKRLPKSKSSKIFRPGNVTMMKKGKKRITSSRTRPTIRHTSVEPKEYRA